MWLALDGQKDGQELSSSVARSQKAGHVGEIAGYTPDAMAGMAAETAGNAALPKCSEACQLEGARAVSRLRHATTGKSTQLGIMRPRVFIGFEVQKFCCVALARLRPPIAPGNFSELQVRE
jgi:hypothetical protein